MTLSPDRAPGPCARALPSVMGGASLTAASFGHPRAGLGIGFEHLIADRALQERQLRLIPAPVHTSHTERRSQEAWSPLRAADTKIPHTRGHRARVFLGTHT